MHRFQRLFYTICAGLFLLWTATHAQDLPPRYATLELFTNTPCPICGSQNPGFFSRLEAYEGQYHLISFYPGRPYASCIFYQANIPENTARLDFYPFVFGTPTVAINGLDFLSSGNVSNGVLDMVTGGESWLSVSVEETSGTNRMVDIILQDHVGGSLSSGKLFAVIVEREIMYNAPNGETVHYNVFRRFLSDVDGDDVDLSSGQASIAYEYTPDAAWQADEIYVIAWLMDPETMEIYNSGTRFDPDIASNTDNTANTVLLNIYPNPATEQIHIELPLHAQDAQLMIYDSGGRLIFQIDRISASRILIETGSWVPGLYHIEISTEDDFMSEKILVAR